MRNRLFIICLLSFGTTFSQDCGDRYTKNLFTHIKRTPNLIYGENINSTGNNEVLKLDVFDPIDDDAPLRPLLLLMHGGAYWSGNKNINEVVIPCRELAKRGFVTATVGYRIEALFTSLLFEDLMVKAVARGTQDAKAAIRYFYKDVIENGNPFRIDTNQIFIGGWSAGGLNALHAAFLDENDDVIPRYLDYINEVGGMEGISGNAGFSSKVAGVINVNGALASAEYMNNSTTPFVSVSNTGDPQIPFYQGHPYGITALPVIDGSMKLHEKALELGIYNPFYIIDNDDHTSSDFFGIPVQPYLDSTLYYTAMFARHVIGCDDVISAIPEKHLSSSVAIYPNPSADFFSIATTILVLPSNSKIQIFDMVGKQVAETLWHTGLRISTSDLSLSPGSYMLLLCSQAGEVFGKAKLMLVR